MELSLIKEASGVHLVQLNAPHLDASNAKAFKEAMEPVLENCQRIVFDMSELRFVDSSGLGALIACLRRTHKSQGDFKLCSMSRPVQALFELMRMHKVFNIHQSPEEAMRSFS